MERFPVDVEHKGTLPTNAGLEHLSFEGHQRLRLRRVLADLVIALADHVVEIALSRMQPGKAQLAIHGVEHHLADTECDLETLRRQTQFLPHLLTIGHIGGDADHDRVPAGGIVRQNADGPLPPHASVRIQQSKQPVQNARLPGLFTRPLEALAIGRVDAFDDRAQQRRTFGRRQLPEVTKEFVDIDPSGAFVEPPAAHIADAKGHLQQAVGLLQRGSLQKDVVNIARKAGPPKMGQIAPTGTRTEPEPAIGTLRSRPGPDVTGHFVKRLGAGKQRSLRLLTIFRMNRRSPVDPGNRLGVDRVGIAQPEKLSPRAIQFNDLMIQIEAPDRQVDLINHGPLPGLPGRVIGSGCRLGQGRIGHESAHDGGNSARAEGHEPARAGRKRNGHQQAGAASPSPRQLRNKLPERAADHEERKARQRQAGQRADRNDHRQVIEAAEGMHEKRRQNA